MMPNFTFPLHNYDSKKRLNRQQVLLRLAPTLVKVNDLTPLRQEFSNSAPEIFGVEYTDSTLDYEIGLITFFNNTFLQPLNRHLNTKTLATINISSKLSIL